MASHSTRLTADDRRGLADWYRRNRARSASLFAVIAEDAYYTRPIDLRNPVVFYEGHLPAFSFNTVVKKGLGMPSIDARLETLFARGIDPHQAQAAKDDPRAGWPSRADVQQFAAEADRQVLDAILNGDIDQPGHPLLTRAEAVYAILEHEAMHQETLLYMWHQLPHTDKHPPAGYAPMTDGTAPTNDRVTIPAGRATLGVDAGARPFSWDNERPALSVDVPAFQIDRHNVTNAAYREFVDAGGYANAQWWRPDDWAWVTEHHLRHPLLWEQRDGPWMWRGMFRRFPLPPSWPVYVSFAEAAAYAAWRGRRLPSEAEFQRAAYGSPDGPADHDGQDRPYPWGTEAPDARHGVFDFSSWHPRAAGSTPAGQSAWGVHDLVGNGWEWTSTLFAPFPGFTPLPSYPEYSADFFDNDHFVIKGASPATARELIRPTFRNWFRPTYPYVYATFRCANDV